MKVITKFKVANQMFQYPDMLELYANNKLSKAVKSHIGNYSIQHLHVMFGLDSDDHVRNITTVTLSYEIYKMPRFIKNSRKSWNHN